jgi:hypothetical protein
VPPVEPVEPELLPLEPLLGELEEPDEPELLGELVLPAPELPLFIAASNSERLKRPSASESAALKSSPDTPEASLEST